MRLPSTSLYNFNEMNKSRHQCKPYNHISVAVVPIPVTTFKNEGTTVSC